MHLWSRTRGFTVKLFSEASHSLAELIYSAWVEAGSPKMDAAAVFPTLSQPGINLDQNSPNPFTSATRITYSLPRKANISLEVRNLAGSTVATIDKGFKQEGSYRVEWVPQNQPAGVYYLVLDTGRERRVKKMIKTE